MFIIVKSLKGMIQIKIIKYEDEQYPELLKNINKPPSILYIEGDLETLKNKSVTVIGSRNMSEYGKKITQKLVKDLTNYNMCIISGMAIGIDSVAHKTCLENGGKTIAVLGSGHNKIFPPENINLYKKIVQSGGCVISEYSPNTVAKKEYFPQRNRIVSGLSLATLVVEATYRSGTSITANFAFSQNRKVFCIPNSIGNKNSMGTINLLKKGAKIITCAEDILNELGISDKKIDLEETQIKKQEKALLLENQILNQLDKTTKDIYYFIKENSVVNSEVICNCLKLNIQEVNTYLSILEIKGLIINNIGNNFTVLDEFR